MAELPISLELAKAHLRVGDSLRDDELIAEKLEMAFGIAEDMTNRDIRAEYTAETIPPAIKAAVLLILGTLYDNESDNIVGRSVSELSLTVEKLLLPWRVTPYGDV
ncbi:head-tail connector protein [Parabacteroides provencensis]|uniref:head-tail connector protein n=1 Tax=Parabacteroides provencensis TaxID=1944636 RepID=UPI000C14C825|nr:head-tail connector protein [Parabacteroides provencensis]